MDGCRSPYVHRGTQKRHAYMYARLSLSLFLSHTHTHMQHVELEDSIKRHIEISQLLQPHPNLCLIRTLTPSPLTGHTSPQSPPTIDTLLCDYTTEDVSSCIPPQMESLNPEAYPCRACDALSAWSSYSQLSSTSTIMMSAIVMWALKICS